MKQIVIGIVLIAALGIITFAIVNQPSTNETANNTKTTTNGQPSQTSEQNTQPAQGEAQDLTTYTFEEVRAHNTQEDCWTVIDGNVYDLTSFVVSHPGGDEILRACGNDATTLFRQRTTEDGQRIGTGTPHSRSAAAQLASLQIGTLAQ